MKTLATCTCSACRFISQRNETNEFAILSINFEWQYFIKYLITISPDGNEKWGTTPVNIHMLRYCPQCGDKLEDISKQISTTLSFPSYYDDTTPYIKRVSDE